MGGSDSSVEWVAAGLYDPAAPQAAERLDLLRWIAAHGATVDQMTTACSAGQLSSLVGDLSLRPGRLRTGLDVATALGMEPALLNDVRRAAGLPAVPNDVPALADDDVHMLEIFHLADAFFSREELLRLATVMGSAMRRIADAAGEMFLRDVEAPLKGNDSHRDLEMAKANLAGIELARSATAVFAPMFLAHLQLSTERTRAARRDSEDYDTVPLAVGFVDLSGFTEMSVALSSAELRILIVDFEGRANGIVGDHDGRIVKLIGDEVMFSAINGTAACAIASALTAAAPAGTCARGGVAFGAVIASGGDLYGPIVNLASRLADIAVPGEVLVNEAIANSVPTRDFEPAGRRQLKGFVEPVRLWSLCD
ncbi:MAG TPA: adenylate cyclase regulatory domain-containing protein [Ilumatobacteraceae bacterium]|nr:adenylate cyclase regulatory domain-containing protein [Ilumatobacteraceae bacterium]